jgi:hypothetical protein
LGFREDRRQSGNYFGNTSPWVLISRYFRIAGHLTGTRKEWGDPKFSECWRTSGNKSSGSVI